MATCLQILGRKYVVLTVNVLNMFLCVGFPFYMSVLNVEFLRVFEESKAQTALVQAFTIGTYNITGFIGGQCVNKYGARKTGMCGGLLAFLGLSSSFFATSIPYLIVSIGVVSGFGFSLAYISCMTSVGEYFNGRAKLVAISVIGIGAGCGGMVFPFLLDYLIKMYGWRGCILIVGGLMANLMCFFAVCKPKSVGMPQRNPEIRCSQDSDRNSKLSVYNDTHVTNHSATNILKEQYTCTDKLNSLRKNFIFIIFILGMSLTLASFGAAMIYILKFLQTKGFDEHKALLLYFYMNIATAIGWLVPGLCILVPYMDCLVVSAIFTSVSCVTSVGLLISTTYYQHVIVMCAFGVAVGCCYTGISMTTMELVGLDNYAIGIGIMTPILGVIGISGAAVSGWLVDVTGSYQASYYSMSAVHGVAACLYILAVALRQCYRSQTYNLR